MRKLFFKGVVKHRKAVIVLFVVAAVVCAFLQPLVGVNYDLNDYLPDGVASTEAIDVMDEEFDGGIPNMRVMVRDVGIEDALACKDAISAVDGVEDVMWLDDAVDIREPIEMQDADTVETYYRDGAALFSVTVEEGREVEAVDGIRAVVGDGAALDGAAVSTAVATTGTVDEINLVTAVAIVVIMLVLFLTTQSWLEPFLVMAGLGVAVLINAGTNLVFGEISFVTNAAGAILQIAISLDFAVFFLHRYHECRGTTASVGADIVSALCKSSTAIFTSGLAITFGFLSLAAMQFKIGPDLGLALAKGMLISLVTVFTFVPAVFATCNAAIEKSRHRPFIGSLKPLGNLVAHVMVPLACAFALLCVPAYLASNSEGISYWYGASHIYGSDTRVGQDTDAITELFGEGDTYALLVPRGNVAAEQALSDDLKALPAVKSVASYVDVAGAEIPPEMASESELEQVESPDYSRLVVSVEVPYEGDETFALVEQYPLPRPEALPRRVLPGGPGRVDLRPHDHGLARQGPRRPRLHRRSARGAVPGDPLARAPDHPGLRHRDVHLAQLLHPLLHGQPGVLHLLPHRKHHPARRHRGLRHPVRRPLQGVPPHAAQGPGGPRHGRGGDGPRHDVGHGRGGGGGAARGVLDPRAPLAARLVPVHGRAAVARGGDLRAPRLPVAVRRASSG